jgi:hypothetical protein
MSIGIRIWAQFVMICVLCLFGPFWQMVPRKEFCENVKVPPKTAVMHDILIHNNPEPFGKAFFCSAFKPFGERFGGIAFRTKLCPNNILPFMAGREKSGYFGT